MPGRRKRRRVKRSLLTGKPIRRVKRSLLTGKPIRRVKRSLLTGKPIRRSKLSLSRIMKDMHKKFGYPGGKLP